MITEEQLKKCIPYALSGNIKKFLIPLNNTMMKFQINTPKRIAAFLAQLAHESGSLTYVKEIASGEAYEGRKDLGNVHKGDGIKFKGRGLIQCTGRANYEAISKELHIDCINKPELLEDAENAALTAGWFWNKKNLNSLADNDNFVTITRKINGGTNGLDDRKQHWERCKKVLNV
jgi:putative chitinase